MCEGSNDNRINRPIKELSNIIRFLLYSASLPLKVKAILVKDYPTDGLGSYIGGIMREDW